MALEVDSPQVSSSWQRLVRYLGRTAPKQLNNAILASKAMVAMTTTHGKRK